MDKLMSNPPSSFEHADDEGGLMPPSSSEPAGACDSREATAHHLKVKMLAVDRRASGGCGLTSL
jgi:hypothetical protein